MATPSPITIAPELAGAVEQALIAGKHIGALTGKLIDGIDGEKYALVPEGFELQTINAKRKERPDFLQQVVTVKDPASFALYLERFATPDTLLFADLGQQHIRAAVDYHAPGKPSHIDHRIVLVCELSDEWKTWAAADKKAMNQLELAEFIENNDTNIVTPTASDLYSVITTFKMKRNVDFSSAVNLTDGQVQLNYVEQNETHTKGNVAIPERFTLGLRPFVGGEPYEVRARLRYRMNDGHVKFQFELHQPKKVLEAAFNDVRAKVEELTKRPTLLGSF
jgi:uncharacterized protein YfdQ (DUF2303 family)